MDGSGAITYGSFRGLFLLTTFVTTCSILVAFLMCHYKKQEERVHIQDIDEGNEVNGGDCNNDDIEDQATISVPDSPNTNSDLPGDCAPNNPETEATY